MKSLKQNSNNLKVKKFFKNVVPNSEFYGSTFINVRLSKLLA